MDINQQHAELVKKLAKSGDLLVTENSPLKAHLNHMCLGLAGEVGEIIDAIKKASIYNKPLDLNNVIEELGDIEFYEGIREALGISRTKTLYVNIEKLEKRYAKGYSDKAAQERADKV